MIKKYLRMILVFSISSLVFLIFLAISGIIRVQGAEIEPGAEISDFRDPNLVVASGSTLQRAILEKWRTLLPAAPLADADLGVIKLDNPDPVIAGNPLTYTLIITNYGPSDAINVTLFDDYLPKLDFIAAVPGPPTCVRQGTNVNCDLGDLGVGMSTQVTLFMHVKSSSSNPLTNFVSVSSDSTDPDITNNQETENTTIIYVSDLSVSTVDDPDPVDPGGTLTYVVNVTNSGPSDAGNVVVTDTLSAEVNLVSIVPSQGTCVGTVCTLGTILSGGNANVTLETTVDPGASGVITNTAQVSSEEADPLPGNNLDYETTVIGAGADLSVVVSDFPDPVSAGDLLSYAITVNNLGTSDASNVVLVDALPAEVTFVSSTPGAPTCSHISGSVTCDLGTLPSGTSADVTLIVLVDPAANGPLVNQVDVSSTVYDPQPANNQVTEETTVIYSSDLSVSTVDDPDPVNPGETLTYIVTVNNNGPSDAAGVVITDTLPFELDLVSITPSQGTCVGTVCTLGTILSGGSANATLVTTVDISASGLIVNSAQVSSEESDPLPGNNLDEETTTIGEGVDLSVTKSDTPDPVVAGELLVYVITVNNLGSIAAPNVTLVDSLPGNVAFISSTPGSPTCVSASGNVTCSLGTLIPGAPMEVTIIARVDSGASGTLTNLANVSSDAFDPDLNNNQVTEDTTIILFSDLSLSIVDDPDPAYPGGILNYILTIANSGPSDGYDVVVTDGLPAEVSLVSVLPSQGSCTGTVCNLGTIVAGENASVNLETTVDLGTSGVITNTALISSVDDPDPLNNTDFELTSIELSADLSITKSDFPDPVTPGELLTYTLNILNSGPLDATSVTVTDTLPAEVSLVSIIPSQGTCAGTVCTLGTILASGDATVILVTTVDDGAAGLITNSAQVSSPDFDPLPDNNLDLETTVVGEIDVADLSITKGAFPDPVAPGALLTYTLNVVNNGPDPALSVIITDTLPTQVTYVSSLPEEVCSENDGVVICGTWTLDPDETTAVNIIVEVDVTAIGPLLNQAQVSSDVPDPETENNQDEVTTDVIAAADLTVSKVGDPPQVEPGGMLTYTLTVTNNGPFLTSGVTLIDTLPEEVTLLDADPSQGSCSGTICSLGTIAVGGSAQVTLLGFVALDASGVITNTAQVYGHLLDPIPENNIALEFTTVGPGADLSLAKTASPDPVIAGEVLTYSLTVENLGPSSASNVTVIDTLPSNVIFLSSTPGAPTCTQSAETVSCNLGTIASNDTRNVIIIVRIEASATGALINQAHVTSDTFDPDPLNDQAQVTTELETSADLVLDILDNPDPVPPGGQLIYTLHLNNNGPSVSRDLQLTIQLPQGAGLLNVMSGMMTCVEDQGLVVCSLNELSEGTETEVGLTMLVDSEAIGTLTLQASLSSATLDPDVGNNSSSETTAVQDIENPTVEWVDPVGNEQRFDVAGEIIQLGVNASDNVGIQRVDFFWWDPILAQFIDIGSVFASPYRIDFDTGVLYDGYNQVYVRAFDTSGNASNRPRILLFRTQIANRLYLPIIRR